MDNFLPFFSSYSALYLFVAFRMSQHFSWFGTFHDLTPSCLQYYFPEYAPALKDCWPFILLCLCSLFPFYLESHSFFLSLTTSYTFLKAISTRKPSDLLFFRIYLLILLRTFLSHIILSHLQVRFSPLDCKLLESSNDVEFWSLSHHRS